MDSSHRVDADSISESTMNDPSSTPYAGAFFPSSQHLIVTGGVFTSNTTNHIHYSTPPLPTDFRMIPLGDIDLRNEIRLDHDAGLVNRRSTRGCVRRMYSARIDGRRPAMTVALYQGGDAEEEWRQDISKALWLRHPNFVQVYAAASAHEIYATIFYDDLILFEDVVELYRHSHFATVYIYAYYNAELADAAKHFRNIFQKSLLFVDCTFWIRRTTSRLCANSSITFGSKSSYIDLFVRLVWATRRMPTPDNILTFNGSNSDTTVISRLTLEHYHEICWWRLSRDRTLSTSLPGTWNLGAVISSSSSKLEDSVEIVFCPGSKILDSGWQIVGDAVIEGTMINGWTRYHSRGLSGIHIDSHRSILLNRESWLCQANYFFSCLRITSNQEDYLFVRDITFQLSIPSTLQNLPEGYLFVCPVEDLQSGPHSFRWPECPAYWSLGPSGVVRLNAEEASQLGFPAVELKMEIYGYSWDASVYAGLRKFHEAKGFDPDSQEVAKHLGYPLFQLSKELGIRFSRVNDQDTTTASEDNVNTIDSSVDVAVSNYNPEDLTTENSETISRFWDLIMLMKATLMLFLMLYEHGR